MSNVNHMHEMIDGLAILAEDSDQPFIASIARGGLKIVEESLRTTSATLSKFKADSGSVDDLGAVMASLVTPESLAEMVAIASEFDKTNDPLLMKQAAVLDEILLTIGAHKETVAAIRRSQDEEIARLKSEAAESKEKDPYTLAKKVHDKSNHVAEGQAAIQKIKDYRPMEAPLNTRTCPDHPGAQMARVAEGTWQCSLDKGIYNYENGYTTMKGNKIPGGDVSNQTQALYDRPNEFTSFETRESKLNPN